MCFNLLKMRANSLVQRGFSLMEIAVVMVILGLVIAPAASMYHQYRIEKDWEEVSDDIDEISNAIGGYRAVYGRYPCPAATNETPGDVGYGFEYAGDCVASAPAPGSCVNGVCAYHNAVSGEDVLVGSLPFKTLNLQEKESFDSFKNRYTYVVTLDLTNNVSFDLSGGGISIFDVKNPAVSLISPPGTAHFVVASHGKNGFGAISRTGATVSPCASGASQEQENCDADSDYMAGSYDRNVFDDRVVYFTSVFPSEWQMSADLGYEDAIHLKNTDSVAIGASMSDNLSASKQTTVKTVKPDTGSIYATMNFVSEQICTFDGTTSSNCFGPEQIAGTLHDNGTAMEAETTGEGMSCYRPSIPGSESYYMVGVSNNTLLCTDEVFVLCPEGMLVSGVYSNGEVKCRDWEGYWCEDEDVNLSCDDVPRGIQGTYSGGYRSVYSGECRMITDYNAAYFEANISGMITVAEAQPLIDTLNAEVRTVGDCGTDYTDSDTQVRDFYLCSNGTWGYDKTYERGSPWDGFPSNIADFGYIGDDPINDVINHDCWCREDYKVREEDCDNGFEGRRLVIEKHNCPQTYHNWEEIYATDFFCECVEGTSEQPVTCDSYYDQITGGSGTTGLTGNVKLIYALTCDVDGNSVLSENPVDSDTSGCVCETRADIINRSYCPEGDINEWVWTDTDGVPHAETAVVSVSVKDWLCPGTYVSDTFGNPVPNPAYYGDEIIYGPETCECDGTYTSEATLSCSLFNKRGGGMTYTRKWDCNTEAWELEDLWELDVDDCDSCAWQSPDGSPSLEDYRYGGSAHEVGAPCSCNDDTTTTFCNLPDGGKYKIWTSCPCVEQTN